MPSKVSANRLCGVPETLLLPLYNRALESKRADAIVRDEKAIELLGRIDYDFSRFGKLHVGFPVRARMDDIVRAFLARYADGVVVNLGGGLDTQFYRVDNGRVLWFEIDLPESIGVRREFFEETARHRMLACSALDFRWMEEIEGRSPVLFVAAGLLPYFPPDEVKRLVATLATRFPGSEMVFDTVSEWFSKLSLKGKAKIGEFILPPMPWGTNRNDLYQVESWHSGIEIVGRMDFTAGYRLRWGIIGIASALPFVANKFHACTVHMRFKRQA